MEVALSGLFCGSIQKLAVNLSPEIQAILKEISLVNWLQLEGKLTNIEIRAKSTPFLLVRSPVSTLKISILIQVLEKDANAELLHFSRVLNLFKDVYSQPLQLDDSLFELSTTLDHLLNGGSCELDPDELDLDFQNQILSKEPNEEYFQIILTSKISSSGLTEFPFDFILRMENIEDYAKRLLKLEDNANPIETRFKIKILVGKLMVKLVKSGFIYIKDAEKDIYELISHDLNLGKDIYDYIKNSASIKEETSSDFPHTSDIPLDIVEILKRLPKIMPNKNDNVDKGSGTSEDSIISHLRKSLKYRNVSKNQVTQSLSKLCAQSLIFESAFKEYKAL